MKISEISKIGSKNELYLPKKIREKLNLKPGTKVIFEVEDKILKLKPIPSVLHLLELRKLAKISITDLKKYRESLNKELKKR